MLRGHAKPRARNRFGDGRKFDTLWGVRKNGSVNECKQHCTSQFIAGLRQCPTRLADNDDALRTSREQAESLLLCKGNLMKINYSA
jgi:hypothetical protein